ncbi:hypothetical protein R1sor_023904 [Riccia sorocarpa]|uniref:Uncharacterized protein n=1 Tax=Riccia sorocarpa TaxID=122646 RepID=A0ABD3GPR3_9MARC
MFKCWLMVRDSLVWDPLQCAVPGDLGTEQTLVLLVKGGLISPEDAANCFAVGIPDAAPVWRLVSSLPSPPEGLCPALCDRLLSLPMSPGNFQLLPSEWKVSLPEQEDFSHIFFACPARGEFWRNFGRNVPVVFPVIRDLMHGVPFPTALSHLLQLNPQFKLGSLLLLSLAFRSCWRRRCSLLFDGMKRSLSWVSILVAGLEVLLAEAKFAGSGKKHVLLSAAKGVMDCMLDIPERFQKSFDSLSHQALSDSLARPLLSACDSLSPYV